MATKLQERKEAEAHQLEQALSALARARSRERHRRRLLGEALAGRSPLPYEELSLPVRNAVSGLERCDGRKAREAFRELMLHVELHGERLLEAQTDWGSNPFLSGLVSLAQQHAHWIRPLATWRPSTHNVGRQYSQLARHLLARYEVPAFLEAVLHDWYCGEDRRSWFRHIGQGGSLRTALGLTIPLTKRMAHSALQAPGRCTVLHALRSGQVLAFGGSARLAEAVNRTGLGSTMESVEHEQWRQTVIQWLVNQPMLDPAHVGPIVAYALRRRRRERRFTMQGRTPQSILRLIQEWQEQQEVRDRERARGEEPIRNRYRYRELPLSGFAPGIWETGRGAQRWIWMIDEIRCNRDLIAEGREMRHCVATFEDSILQGTSSIWSMKVERPDGVQRAVTIEVCPRTRLIVECRGKCNRTPTTEERRILGRWAKENRLEIAL